MEEIVSRKTKNAGLTEKDGVFKNGGYG